MGPRLRGRVRQPARYRLTALPRSSGSLPDPLVFDPGGRVHLRQHRPRMQRLVGPVGGRRGLRPRGLGRRAGIARGDAPGQPGAHATAKGEDCRDRFGRDDSRGRAGVGRPARARGRAGSLGRRARAPGACARATGQSPGGGSVRRPQPRPWSRGGGHGGRGKGSANRPSGRKTASRSANPQGPATARDRGIAMSDATTDMEGRAGPVMEDWGKVISFRPDLVLRPTSIDELKPTLERIHRGELGSGRVRVPGSLHSCSEIVVSDAFLDTSGLPKTIDFEAGNAAVVASANVTLHDFLAELGRRGKSLTATGGTDHQTLAGLISTGTAPASSREALYDLLEWVELVTVDATTGRAVERRISRGDADFPAVVCSLGLLGVLTRVGFGLVDERHFSVVQKMLRLDDVLADLDATSTRYDYWRINWMQKSDKALLWAATSVPSKQSKTDGDYSS